MKRLSSVLLIATALLINATVSMFLANITSLPFMGFFIGFTIIGNLVSNPKGSFATSVFISSGTERQLFKQARTALIAAGVSAEAYDGALNTQGILRLIQPITTTNNTIEFPVLNNQQGTGGTTRPDEVRLTQQNAFFVAKVNMYILNFPSATSTVALPNTYPNSVTFPTGSGPLAELYRGMMRIIINNNVIVPQYPLSNFLQVPQTQLTAATNSPQDMFDGTNQLPWEPNISFIGLNDNRVYIVMPAAVTAVDANTYVQIDLQGVLSQNVALGAFQSTGTGVS